MTFPRKLNGTPANQFDKLMRRDDMQKADEAMRVIKRLSPGIARTIDDIDMKFADILARLQKIEDTNEAQARTPSRIMPPREPSGEEVLRAMSGMTPEARAAMLAKLKQ